MKFKLVEKIQLDFSKQLFVLTAMNDEQEQFLRELVGPVGKFFEVI